MTAAASERLAIFAAAPPGLETLLREEIAALGFAKAKAVPGGVDCSGTWPDIWRLNLLCRGASRILVRIGAFPAAHLSQLDKRARKLPWRDVLHPDVPVAVEASCRRSKIYHSGAAAERIEKAVQSAGITLAGDGIKLLVRIERNHCTISVDTSGEGLHKRGFKTQIGKAPMRETMAALFLRECGYDGGEPLVDPMCGSGTFPIEAAEVACGLAPGRGRDFAFQKLATFDAEAWAALKDAVRPRETTTRVYGYDRDAGAIAASIANAERAGVASIATFRQQPISELVPPEGPPGLVIVNPPYGARIGDPKALRALYATFGRVLRERFAGWRAGLITSDAKLAHATGLPFEAPGPPVPHGALRVWLYRTGPLAPGQ